MLEKDNLIDDSNGRCYKDMWANLVVYLVSDSPLVEESWLELLPNLHYPKEQVWRTSENKQVKKNTDDYPA